LRHAVVILDKVASFESRGAFLAPLRRYIYTKKGTVAAHYRNLYDVVIIGAGPAGATAGYELAQKV